MVKVSLGEIRQLKNATCLSGWLSINVEDEGEVGGGGLLFYKLPSDSDIKLSLPECHVIYHGQTGR